MCVVFTHIFTKQICRLPLGKKVARDDFALHSFHTFFRMREETTKKQTQQSPPPSEETPSAILPSFHHHEIKAKKRLQCMQARTIPHRNGKREPDEVTLWHAVGV